MEKNCMCVRACAHACNPLSWVRGRQISKLEASLVYRPSSKTAKTTQKKLVSKTKTKQIKNKLKQKKIIYHFIICCFETRSHVTQAGLKLTM